MERVSAIIRFCHISEPQELWFDLGNEERVDDFVNIEICLKYLILDQLKMLLKFVQRLGPTKK